MTPFWNENRAYKPVCGKTRQVLNGYNCICENQYLRKNKDIKSVDSVVVFAPIIAIVYFYGSKEQKQNFHRNRFFVRARRHSLVCVLLRRVVKTKTKSFSETIVKRARHVVGERSKVYSLTLQKYPESIQRWKLHFPTNFANICSCISLPTLRQRRTDAKRP